jgi:hypothetical protein
LLTATGKAGITPQQQEIILAVAVAGITSHLAQTVKVVLAAEANKDIAAQQIAVAVAEDITAL